MYLNVGIDVVIFNANMRNIRENVIYTLNTET